MEGLLYFGVKFIAYTFWCYSRCRDWLTMENPSFHAPWPLAYSASSWAFFSVYSSGS